MIKNLRQERRDRILAVLFRHRELDDSITWEELAGEGAVSFGEARRIVWQLANHDRIPIAMNPNPPYGLYIKHG